MITRKVYALPAGESTVSRRIGFGWLSLIGGFREGSSLV